MEIRDLEHARHLEEEKRKRKLANDAAHRAK